MKILAFFFLMSMSCFAGVHPPCEAYANTHTVESISLCDTVVMQVHSAGCFHSYDQTYTFYKQGRKRRVVYRSGLDTLTKKIGRRAYKKFMACYRKSYDHFSPLGDRIHCTTVSSYKLSGCELLATFSNISCEADYEPERLLKNLLK